MLVYWSVADIVTWTLGMKILCLPIQGARSLSDCRNRYSCDTSCCDICHEMRKHAGLESANEASKCFNIYIHDSKDIKWIMQSLVLTSWPIQIWKASNYEGMRQPEVMRPLTRTLPISSFGVDFSQDVAGHCLNAQWLRRRRNEATDLWKESKLAQRCPGQLDIQW